MANSILGCICYLVLLVSLTPANALTADQQRVLKNTSLDKSQIGRPIETKKVDRVRSEAISDLADFIRAKLNAVRAANPIGPLLEIISEQTEQDVAEAQANPSFLLKALTFDGSHYLDQTVFDQLNSQLAGRPINLPVLSAVPAIINEVYAAAGVLTGSAVLEPQTSENGVIHVSLIEPVVGEVRVSNVGRTKPSYIENRIGITSGEHPQFAKISQDLFVFSTLNNIKLTAQFEPTDSPDIVDIILLGGNPKETTATIFHDNHGAFETGYARFGGSFQHMNFSGYRDILSASSIGSEGLKTGSVNYSFPVGFTGTRISAGGTYSSSRVIYGPLANTDLESQSKSGVLSFQHPVVVEPDRIGWIGVSGNLENLTSQISGVELTNAKIKEASIFTNWLWRKPRYTAAFNIQIALGNALSKTSTSTDGDFQYIQGGFDLVGALSETFAFKIDLDAKYGLSRNNPTSVLHSSGGSASVRGYPESLLSGDSGANLTFEVSLMDTWAFETGAGGQPQTATINPFSFFDMGIAVPFRATGRAIKEEDVIASIGFGLNANIGSNLSGNLTIGIPLRDTTGFDASAEDARVSFKLASQF